MKLRLVQVEEWLTITPIRRKFVVQTDLWAKCECSRKVHAEVDMDLLQQASTLATTKQTIYHPLL